MKTSLGITREGGMEIYLRMPEKICSSKTQVFSFIQEQMNGRLTTGWVTYCLVEGKKWHKQP